MTIMDLRELNTIGTTGHLAERHPDTTVQPDGGDALPADELPPNPDRPDTPVVEDDDGDAA